VRLEIVQARTTIAATTAHAVRIELVLDQTVPTARLHAIRSRVLSATIASVKVQNV